MPTTLTLKGIPDELHDRLKQTAEINRRSLNNEAIFLLASVLLPRRVTATERIADARRLREGLDDGAFDAKTIDAHKRRDRR